MEEPSARTGPSTISRRVEICLLIGILLVAFAARAYRISDESLWHDEAVGVQFADAPNLFEFYRAEHRVDPGAVPLYFVLEFACLKLVPDRILGCRMMSVMLGLGAIVMVHLLGRRMFGPVAGLFAALCAALAPPHIYYSQEIRMYALYGLLAVASVHTFLRHLEDGTERSCLAHCLVNALLVWTHLFGALLIGAEACVLLVARWRARPAIARWMAVHAVLGLSVFMWVLGADGDSINREFAWIAPASWSIVRIGLRWIFTGTASGVGLNEAGGPARVAAAAGMILLWGVLVLLAARRCFRPGEADSGSRAPARLRFGLLTAWMILPYAALFTVSALVRPCFVARYCYPSTFALYLLAGCGVAAIPRWGLRAVPVAALVGISAFNMYDYGRPMRADLRSAARVFAVQSGADDLLLVRPAVCLLPARIQTPIRPERVMPFNSSKRMLRKAVDLLSEGRGCWLLDAPFPSVTRDDLEERLNRLGLAYEVHRFPGHIVTSLYQLTGVAAARVSISDP